MPRCCSSQFKARAHSQLSMSESDSADLDLDVERADTGSAGLFADLEDVSTIQDDDDGDDDDDDAHDDDNHGGARLSEDDSSADSVDPLVDYDSEETVEASVDGGGDDDTDGAIPLHLDLYRQAGEQLAAAVLATARAASVTGPIGAMFWKDTGMLPLSVFPGCRMPKRRVLVFMAVDTHPGAERTLRWATRALDLQPRPLWKLTVLEDAHCPKVVYGFLLPKDVRAWAATAPFLGEHRDAELLPRALHPGLSGPAVLGMLLRHLLTRVLPGAMVHSGESGLQVHVSGVGGFRPSGYAYVCSATPVRARQALATLRGHLGLRRDAVPVAARWARLHHRDDVWLPTLLCVDTSTTLDPTTHWEWTLPCLRLW